MPHLLVTIITLISLMALSTRSRATDVDIEPMPLPVADSPARDKIVRAVKQWNQQRVADARNCAGSEFTSRATVLLDTPTLFSVETSESGYCGGPHPFFNEEPLTFDATSGEPYNPLSLYRVAKAPSTGSPLSWQPTVRRVIKKALLDAREPSNKNDDCTEVLEEDEPGPDSPIDWSNLALGPDELRVYPAPPHAIQACYEPVVQLPYSALQQYLDCTEAARLGWKAQCAR